MSRYSHHPCTYFASVIVWENGCGDMQSLRANPGDLRNKLGHLSCSWDSFVYVGNFQYFYVRVSVLKVKAFYSFYCYQPTYYSIFGNSQIQFSLFVKTQLLCLYAKLYTIDTSKFLIGSIYDSIFLKIGLNFILCFVYEGICWYIIRSICV